MHRPTKHRYGFFCSFFILFIFFLLQLLLSHPINQLQCSWWQTTTKLSKWDSYFKSLDYATARLLRRRNVNYRVYMALTHTIKRPTDLTWCRLSGLKHRLAENPKVKPGTEQMVMITWSKHNKTKEPQRVLFLRFYKLHTLHKSVTGVRVG